jgi:putative ABC transport system substrate-binding protein
MNRRDMIALLGGAAVWPVTARAQQALPVIGFLNGQSRDQMRGYVAAFQRGLAEAGYVEGQNVAIEYRWADGQYDRLPALADDLVRLPSAVIVSGGSTVATLAAKAATKSIPIIFATGPDPVEIGLVASLNRPGGNLTGVTNLNIEVIAKRLGLLHELVPTATTIAVLLNAPTLVTTAAEIKELQAAARVIGVRLVVLNAALTSAGRAWARGQPYCPD